MPSTKLILALEAFEHVHNSRVSDYLEHGQAIDDLVKLHEPGMLVHALTTASEDEEKTVFCWLEVFENAEALDTHLSSAHVTAHLEKLADGILCDKTDLVIYADWDDELKTQWIEKLPGANVIFADAHASFFRAR